jgi:hypothetical protein
MIRWLRNKLRTQLHRSTDDSEPFFTAKLTVPVIYVISEGVDQVQAVLIYI